MSTDIRTKRVDAVKTSSGKQASKTLHRRVTFEQESKVSQISTEARGERLPQMLSRCEAEEAEDARQA